MVNVDPISTVSAERIPTSSSAPTPPQTHQSALMQWFKAAIADPEIRMQVRLQGNYLHLLCESLTGPEPAPIISQLIRALVTLPQDGTTGLVTLANLLPADHPVIYQMVVYGRLRGQRSPEWTELIYLNQSDRYLTALNAIPTPLTPVEPATSEAISPSPAKIIPAPAVTSSALVVSNRSLARRGDPDAIARYLSETLSALGVAVQVRVKAIAVPAATPKRELPDQQRLYILCEAPYSPDPALVSEPIAQKLRELELETFRDAVIRCQVRGEEQVDWLLRVDLTPPEEMLWDWARWGDVTAITHLLNHSLAEQGVVVTVSLQAVTLHIICTLKDPTPEALIPDQTTAIKTVMDLLTSIAPQGIQAAALYGQEGKEAKPAWVDWQTLPAARHVALMEPPLSLAKQGDEEALGFLLNRALNPNLDWRLATGGIRVQLLRKDELLHLMHDAPICPSQSQVVEAVVPLLQSLKLPTITGVRLYGRRAGQKRPLWSYAKDFVTRDRPVSEAPDFATAEAYLTSADAYLDELLAMPDEEVLRPDLTPDALQSQWAQIQQQVVEAIQGVLVRSQLFVIQETEHPDLAPAPNPQAWPVALVWGTAGLLLTFSLDLIGGQVLQANVAPPSPTPTPSLVASPSPSPSPAIAPLPTTPDSSPSPTVPLPKLSLQKSADTVESFNASGFIKPGDSAVAYDSTPPDTATFVATNTPLPAEAIKPVVTPAQLQALRPNYPTFNSRQLDEKLALYQQLLSESGPPDVLIIGSSRALRGIDPVALKKALATQGYTNLKIFNFGVNGATVQVVDLILRQLLQPNQLPKLVIWADGARAFNSGRNDATYNAIAVSPGFKYFQAGHPAITIAASTPNTTDNATAQTDTPAIPLTRLSLASHYQALNDWLNQWFGNLSSSYSQRTVLQTQLHAGLANLLPKQKQLPDLRLGTTGEHQTASAPSQEGDTSQSDFLYAIDTDGFLPLSTRFNPATYYQKYARVSGDFDGDYEAFQLQGKQSQSLDRLLAHTQLHQVPVVFVNLPLTQDYLDPVRRTHEQEFQDFMLRQSTQKGFVFRDLSQAWVSKNDYFSDPSHLNRYGAYVVSQRLAQDGLIPWPQPATPTEPVLRPPTPPSNLPAN